MSGPYRTKDDELSIVDLERAAMDAPHIRLTNGLLLELVRMSGAVLRVDGDEGSVWFRVDDALAERSMSATTRAQVRTRLCEMAKLGEQTGLGRIQLRLGTTQDVTIDVFRVDSMRLVVAMRPLLELSRKLSVQEQRDHDLLAPVVERAEAALGSERLVEAAKLAETAWSAVQMLSGSPLRQRVLWLRAATAEGSPDEPERWRAWVEELQAQHGPEHDFVGTGRVDWANALARAGEHDEAIEVGEEGVAVVRAALGAEHPQTLGVSGTLAKLYQGAGRRDAARELAQAILPALRDLFVDHPLVAEVGLITQV